jgi:hypothetical protein
MNHNSDARRCYWGARHFLGTLMGRRIYDAAKRSMKSAPRRELVRGGEVAN